MNNWDNPTPAPSGYEAGAMRQKRPAFQKADPQVGDGFFDPFAFLMFLLKNSPKILVLTLLLTVLGFFIFTSIPFPYKAKAIILVDPREKGITVSEQVIANIDGDAAVLESIVELVQSDGFVRPLLKKLDVIEDPQFSNEALEARQGDDRALLNSFKKGLQVLRLGATYVVEVNYTADDPKKSAFYANGIANAFVEEQASSQLTATSSAAESLAGRLAELNKVLQKSEKAVADFRAAQNIVSVDSASTLLQRELTALSQQVAEAKSNTEVWRAQYDQVRTNNDANFNTLGDQSETQTLQTLNQQKSQISQNLAQLNLTFGSRHPRITAERSRLTAIDAQIAQEKRRLIGLGEKRLDAAIATQNALEAELDALRKQAAETETALVRLGELEREAAANREIYEDFLARFKSAKEQRGFQNREARLASPASEPLYSTRPSKALAGGVIFLLSLILSTILVLAVEILRGKRPAFNKNYASFSSSYQDNENKRQPFNSTPDYPEKTSPDISSRPIARNWNERFFTPRKKKERTKAPSYSGGNSFDNNRVNQHTPSSRYPKPAMASPSQFMQNRTPVHTVTHIPRSSLRHEAELEQAIAYQLRKDGSFLPTPHNRSGSVILVTSWFNREGKTTLAQSIATLFHESHLESILIKTPQNAQFEMQRGISSSHLKRPYTILDPTRERLGKMPAHKSSFHALEALIEECRYNFGLVVLDASTIKGEKHISALSHLADKTLIVFDRPDDNKINIIADKTARANFHNPHIILNNV